MSQLPLTHNPQAYFNGFISIMRSSILISTVGLTTFTLSKLSKKYSLDILLVSIFIIILSIIFSLKASYDLHQYLTFLKKQEHLKPPYTFLIKDWYTWIILNNIYSGILIIIVFFILFGKILKKL